MLYEEFVNLLDRNTNKEPFAIYIESLRTVNVGEFSDVDSFTKEEFDRMNVLKQIEEVEYELVATIIIKHNNYLRVKV